MRVIIAGSRGVGDFSKVESAIHGSGFLLELEEVVSGGAEGVDELGEIWANRNLVPVKHFLPDWEKNGKAAGPIRNREMAEYSDALIAIWDGRSRGTKNMIDEAFKRQLKIYVQGVGY